MWYKNDVLVLTTDLISFYIAARLPIGTKPWNLEDSNQPIMHIIVAAFRGMHVSPAKHSYAWLPRKCDYRTDTRTDRQTDAGQSDPYVPLCFAGDTKTTRCIMLFPRLLAMTFTILDLVKDHWEEFNNRNVCTYSPYCSFHPNLKWCMRHISFCITLPELMKL